MNLRSDLIVLSMLMVAFVYFAGSVSAAACTSCPDGVRVDDSWWVPSQCLGGVHAGGEIEFKWDSVPGDGVTERLGSEYVSMSARSTGATARIEAWNGDYWTFVTDSWIDFSGVYVYNMMRTARPYADGSHRVRVTNLGPGGLQLDEVNLTATYESLVRDIEIQVTDCYTGMLMEGVEIKEGDSLWMTDSGGEATVRLPEGHYQLSVKKDRYYPETLALSVDRDRYLDVCVRKIEAFGVDVYGLGVDGSEISFNVRNTGNDYETISYEVIVDGNEVFENSLLLDADESERLEFFHGFMPGRHSVTARASLNSHSDSQTTTYCVAGVSDMYRCYGGDVQRQVVKSGCSVSWEKVRDCEHGCSNGECVYDERHCSVSISSVSYEEILRRGETQSITVFVENSGSLESKTTVKVYVNDRFQSSHYITVDAGSTTGDVFRFSMPSGVHDLRVELEACGASRDVFDGEVLVMSQGGSQPSSGGSGGSSSGSVIPQETLEFYMRIVPQTNNITLGEGAVFEVEIHSSRTENMIMTVDGMDSRWLGYPGVAEVPGEKTVHVYAAPKKAGSYRLRIALEGDGVTKDAVVRLFVNKEPEAGPGGDFLTGLVTFGGSSVLFAEVLAVILAAITAAILSHKFIFKQSDDFVMLEYDKDVQRMAKA